MKTVLRQSVSQCRSLNYDCVVVFSCCFNFYMCSYCICVPLMQLNKLFKVKVACYLLHDICLFLVLHNLVFISLNMVSFYKLPSNLVCFSIFLSHVIVAHLSHNNLVLVDFG